MSESTYDVNANRLAQCDGCRVRLTYANGRQQVGKLTVHFLGVGRVRDLRINGIGGGLNLETVQRMEVMGNRRYVPLGVEPFGNGGGEAHGVVTQRRKDAMT